MRLELSGDGYEFVRTGRTSTPVYIHRLALVAWVDASSTTEAVSQVAGHDVHHEVPDDWLSISDLEQLRYEPSVPWLNVEGGLWAEEWTEHRRRTLSPIQP